VTRLHTKRSFGMSGNDYLADTNVLIHLLSGKTSLADFLHDKTLFISFISEIELLSKPGLTTSHIKVIEELVANCIVIDYNHEIKAEAINIRRLTRLKIRDSLVLATAKFLDVPLISFDKDFSKVKDVEILNLIS
jgi:predicted nucleic acid-binding protein